MSWNRKHLLGLEDLSREEIIELLDTAEGLDFTEEVAHFFDCIDTGIPCQTDGKTVRALMSVLFDAIGKAEAEGAV